MSHEKDTYRELLPRSIKRASILIGLCATAYIAQQANQTIDAIGDFDLPSVSEFIPETEVGPSIVIAGVDYDSIEVERNFNLRCYQQISAQVGVTGRKEGWSVFGLSLGDGVVDKKYFLDYILCSDESEVIDAVETIDPVSNTVTSLHVTLPKLEVTHPRLDHLDFRNCLDLRADDTQERVQELENSYLANDSDDVECDNGFSLNGVGSPSLSELTSSSMSAAQLAILVDAAPREMIESLNAQRINTALEEMRDDPRYAHAEISIDVESLRGTSTNQNTEDRLVQNIGRENETTTDQDINDLLNQEASELESLFKQVSYSETEDGQSIMTVETLSGDTFTIQLGLHVELTKNLYEVES